MVVMVELVPLVVEVEENGNGGGGGSGYTDGSVVFPDILGGGSTGQCKNRYSTNHINNKKKSTGESEPEWQSTRILSLKTG